MKYMNIVDENTTSSIMDWLLENFNLDKIPISVSLNQNGSIKTLEINKKLSNADKTKIITKFPELDGKESE